MHACPFHPLPDAHMPAVLMGAEQLLAATLSASQDAWCSQTIGTRAAAAWLTLQLGVAEAFPASAASVRAPVTQDAPSSCYAAVTVREETSAAPVRAAVTQDVPSSCYAAVTVREKTSAAVPGWCNFSCGRNPRRAEHEHSAIAVGQEHPASPVSVEIGSQPCGRDRQISQGPMDSRTKLRVNTCVPGKEQRLPWE